MQLIKYGLAVFLLVCLLPVKAQVPDGFRQMDNTAEVKKMISANAAETHSLSSDFTQEKHLTMMEEVLVSQGRFLFKKENQVRWEYLAPIRYTIIINGNRFVINNDGKISSFDTESNKLFREINNMIMMAIQGNFVDDPSFEASFFEDDEHYLAILSPRDNLLRSMLENIHIFFDKADISVTTVRFIEPAEDFTNITFTNRKKNTPIEDELFNTGG